jgi:uncharacterized protein YjbJ (UPF0337 family)
MNQDMAQGKWQQLSGKIKQKWGKLTDDDLTRASGDREYLVGKLHEQYGLAKDKAERELDTLGYSEDDQNADLRSSSRSSAGRMDMAGQSGSDRKIQAGGSDVDSQRNADIGSNRRSGVNQESGYEEDSGSSSQRNAEQGPAGHTLEAGADKQRSGSNNPQGGSRNPSDKSSQQQKGGQKAPGGSSGNR